MKIVYIAQPIRDILEVGELEIRERVAKEALKAIIEESLMSKGLVESYTVIHSDAFPFPGVQPDILSLDGFFGEDPDLNFVAWEIRELYKQPEREISKSDSKFKSRLKKATDRGKLGMFDEYYYTSFDLRRKYPEAVDNIEGLWRTYEEAAGDLKTTGFSRWRNDLTECLNLLDDCHARGYFEERKKLEDFLETGRIQEANTIVLSAYQDWSLSNLAQLYYECMYHRDLARGYFMARLVVAGEQSELQKVEKELNRKQMPYQIIES